MNTVKSSEETTTTAATGTDDEPILRALTTMGTEISNALGELGMPLRIFVIIAGIVLLSVFVLPIAAGFAIPLLLAYTIYFFIRTATLDRSRTGPPPAQTTTADMDQTLWRSQFAALYQCFKLV